MYRLLVVYRVPWEWPCFLYKTWTHRREVDGMSARRRRRGFEGEIKADSPCSHLSLPRQAAAASFPRRYLLFVLSAFYQLSWGLDLELVKEEIRSFTSDLIKDPSLTQQHKLIRAFLVRIMRRSLGGPNPAVL